MKNLFLALSALFAVSSLGSQVRDPVACEANPHKITYLPSFSVNPQHFPCMYSGTFEVSRKPDTSHNLFYWLHRNTTLEPATSPLIIWIQGEIGVSASQGQFVQHGPLQVSQKLNKTGVYQYTVAPAEDGTTLTEIGDVLYLDQPVGTGFSYGANDTDILTNMLDI
jgi:carboxypeptidase C (cathepsin A)